MFLAHEIDAMMAKGLSLVASLQSDVASVRSLLGEVDDKTEAKRPTPAVVADGAKPTRNDDDATTAKQQPTPPRKDDDDDDDDDEPAAGSSAASAPQSAAEKRVRKLKKALKRIGSLRREDYLTLKTAQRVKIHGEADVLEELRSLGVIDVEDVRAALQPGLEKPMPRSKSWSKERDAARTASAADREAEGHEGQRTSDWTCKSCGAICFAKRRECFECGLPR